MLAHASPKADVTSDQMFAAVFQAIFSSWTASSSSSRMSSTSSRVTEAIGFVPIFGEIHAQSSGFLREVKNAVAAVERFGKLQGLGQVEAKHVAGKRLCQDRNDARARGAGL